MIGAGRGATEVGGGVGTRGALTEKKDWNYGSSTDGGRRV